MILVTGAAGMIERHLIARLRAKGMAVRSRARTELQEGLARLIDALAEQTRPAGEGA